MCDLGRRVAPRTLACVSCLVCGHGAWLCWPFGRGGGVDAGGSFAADFEWCCVCHLHLRGGSIVGSYRDIECKPAWHLPVAVKCRIGDMLPLSGGWFSKVSRFRNNFVDGLRRYCICYSEQYSLDGFCGDRRHDDDDFDVEIKRGNCWMNSHAIRRALINAALLALGLGCSTAASGQALPPPLPGSEQATPEPAPPVLPQSAVTPTSSIVPQDVIAAFEARRADLEAREAAAIAARMPATPELLDELETALANGASPELLVWEEQSFQWYAQKIVKSDTQVGAAFPGRDAVLEVAMMRVELDYTATRPDTNQDVALTIGTPVLQVARAGSPVRSIIWIAEFGYLALPAEYVSPHIPRDAVPQSLTIGGER